jgi:transmembrane protein
MIQNKRQPDRMTGAAGQQQATGKPELACRLLLSAVFLATGIAALMSPAGFAQGLGQMGVPFPPFCAIVVTGLNIVGPFILVSDLAGLGWVAAFALSCFTALTIPFGHPFWAFDEPRRTEELRIAIEHVSLIGGLMLAGLASLSRWRDRRSNDPARR